MLRRAVAFVSWLLAACWCCVGVCFCCPGCRSFSVFFGSSVAASSRGFFSSGWPSGSACFVWCGVVIRCSCVFVGSWFSACFSALSFFASSVVVPGLARVPGLGCCLGPGWVPGRRGVPALLLLLDATRGRR
uniref:Secreted protein n=1 Tax=Anopheles darlingi TaxID=43151 RepID=A0A2M4DPY7_ANODA